MPQNISFMELPKKTEPRAPDASQGNLRGTKLWDEISGFYKAMQKPAFGKISNAWDLQLSPKGDILSFTGSYWNKPDDSSDELNGTPMARICLVFVTSKELQMITHGPNNDKLARWSPDGQRLLFLSDRSLKGIFQPYILNRAGFGEAELVVDVKGKSVEYAEWSPDGNRILLGIAGLSADKAAAGQIGGSGKVGGADGRSSADSWLPSVSTRPQENEWRRLWIFDLTSKNLTRLDSIARNHWEAAWCGNQRLITISSAHPGEESWYLSDVEVIDVTKEQPERSSIQRYEIDGKVRQFGSPVASADGKTVAFVRCLASDRGVIAGDIYVARLSEPGKQHNAFRIDIDHTDVTFLKLLDSNTLIYTGISDIRFTVGKVDLQWQNTELEHFKSEEVFQSSEGCADPYYPKVAASVGSTGQAVFALILQSRLRPPEIGMVENRAFSKIYSFDHPGFEWLRSKVGKSTKVSWKSSDGLEIHGILDLPTVRMGEQYPLILHVHGGPVFSWQNTWTGWNPLQILVARGYAVLSTNPRGSSGRGQTFAETVLGDVGGMETQDHLSGIDYLIETGVADPHRIGVMGGSHGGFMASWIVSQDPRFKACVPLAAVTDWHSQ